MESGPLARVAGSAHRSYGFRFERSSFAEDRSAL
jgi:hypothetical protein